MFPILTHSLLIPPTSLPQLKCDLSLSDDVGIITSDIMKPEDADSLAKQAEIIITTVGPYRYTDRCVSCGGSSCMLGWAFLCVLLHTYPFPYTFSLSFYCLQNSLYSEQLVRACAESGTHLIDITGEVLWVKDMIER